MTSLVKATRVTFDQDSMWVSLSDGRTLSVPLAWFPRLLHASPAETSRSINQQPWASLGGAGRRYLDCRPARWTRRSRPADDEGGGGVGSGSFERHDFQGPDLHRGDRARRRRCGYFERQDAARGDAGTVHRAWRRHADRAVTGRRSKVPAVLLALAALLCSAGTTPAQQRACGSREPINTLAELWPALYACWSPPAGTEGKELTLRFSIRRDGTLIGKPRATYSKLEGGGDLDRVSWPRSWKRVEQDAAAADHRRPRRRDRRTADGAAFHRAGRAGTLIVTDANAPRCGWPFTRAPTGRRNNPPSDHEKSAALRLSPAASHANFTAATPPRPSTS